MFSRGLWSAPGPIRRGKSPHRRLGWIKRPLEKEILCFVGNRHGLRDGHLVAIVACTAGVPNDMVRSEANTINKSVEVAQAMHAKCVDAGGGVDPATVATLCQEEARALADIQTNTGALLQAAGGPDGGTDGGQ